MFRRKVDWVTDLAVRGETDAVAERLLAYARRVCGEQRTDPKHIRLFLNPLSDGRIQVHVAVTERGAADAPGVEAAGV